MTDNFDDELWRQETSDTKKLGAKEKMLQKKPVTTQERRDFAGSGHRIAPQQVRGDIAELAIGDLAHVDRNTGEKLRRGEMPIEGRLDLHGMTQAEAFPELHRFITEAYASGKRCLLVVTGKGSRSESGRGILQEAVPRWLNTPELRPAILVFCPAQARDGGTGALYVLLKRHRD